MKQFKNEIIAFKKDNTLVVFDNREEYLKEFSSKKGYSRVFASASECVRQSNDEDTAYFELSTKLARLCEEFSIDIN
jgi:hypothetical protein